MTSRGTGSPHRDDWAKWQLAELVNPVTGGLSSTFRLSSWTVPEKIELLSGRICWDRSTPERRYVSSSAHILDELVGLVSASDSQIFEYAKKYGVIAECETHGLPYFHALTQIDEDVRDVCRLQGDARPFVEVERYRQIGRFCRAILNIASSLHDGSPGRSEDWGLVAPSINSVPSYIAGSWRPVQPTIAQRIIDEKEVLADLLDRWLRICGVRLCLDWNLSTPQLGIAVGGMLPSVMASLALAVARANGISFCDECKRPFLPKRQPSAGRRRYCEDPECKKASRRDAKRDERDRSRRGP